MVAESKNRNAELFQQVYDTLRDLATLLLNQERVNHTLQPTALVNEAFVKLENGCFESTRNRLWNSKTHFQIVAASAMRQILVDYARQRLAQKRGGDWQRVSIPAEELLDKSQSILAMVDIDEALKSLASLDERKSRVVELRFFGGMTYQEIGAELGVSPKTAEADWYFAKAWLQKHISGTAR